MFTEFLKEQFDGFKDSSSGIISDIIVVYNDLRLKSILVDLLVIFILVLLWIVNLLLHIGSIVVVGSMLLFKYSVNKIRNLFNG